MLGAAVWPWRKATDARPAANRPPHRPLGVCRTDIPRTDNANADAALDNSSYQPRLTLVRFTNSASGARGIAATGDPVSIGIVGASATLFRSPVVPVGGRRRFRSLWTPPTVQGMFNCHHQE